MNYQAIPDNASLFTVRNKLNPKSPDLRGEIILSEALMQDLINDFKAGNQPKIDVGIWRKSSERAGEFFSIRISKAYKRHDSEPVKQVERTVDDDVPF
jgi:hypothetical protein